MSGGPQRLNKINLYGKNPIPVEKFCAMVPFPPPPSISLYLLVTNCL